MSTGLYATSVHRSGISIRISCRTASQRTWAMDCSGVATVAEFVGSTTRGGIAIGNRRVRYDSYFCITSVCRRAVRVRGFGIWAASWGAARPEAIADGWVSHVDTVAH